MEQFHHFIELLGMGIDGIGVLVIVLGALYAIGRFLFHRAQGGDSSFRTFRQNIGRAILLGLEFLVAGDIIRTVVFAPTLENVLVLGLIVLIRTFLSMSLQMELEGRWPWQRPRQDDAKRVT